MNRQTLLRIGVGAVAVVLVATCASFRSPHQGFLGELGSGLVLLIVLSMIGGLVVGGLAAVMSRPVDAEDAAWLKVLGVVGQVCVWLALTPPMFYLLAPMVGLSGLLLAFPCAVLVAGAWGLMRRSLLKWERSDALNWSPWSVTRTLLVAAATLVVLFEVLDVGRGRFGSRLLGLFAAALGASSTAVDWLRLARAGFTAIVGGFGFYWALSPVTSFPPFIRAALFGARVLVTLGLSVAFSVWAGHSGDFEDVLSMLPDALALVGCWSYAHACWESRLIASRRAGTPESSGATAVS